MKIKMKVLFLLILGFIFLDTGKAYCMNAKVNELEYYIVISPNKEEHSTTKSEPGYWANPVEDYCFLGKIWIDSNLNINYKFLNFTKDNKNEEEVRKTIDYLKGIIEKTNKKTSFETENKKIFPKNKETLDQYLKEVFEYADIDKFKDNKLGEKYFKKGQKYFSIKEIEDKIIYSRIYR
ncbi:MAG: hypothetical protein NT145_05410 [Elusimicrobia bacterium]|nr:hypothetical protein [Elusimicrobiota bacterium]